MNSRVAFSPGFPCLITITLFQLVLPLSAAPILWDNDSSTPTWSNADNWDPDGEPTSADDLTFPAGLSGTITLASGENARSLQFDNDYILTGGGLTLASASSIGVANGVTATLVSPVVLTGGSTKTGPGTLVISGSNTNATGIVIDGGRLRVTLPAALTTGGTTVNSGAFLEIANNIALNVPIALNHGGTVSSIGSPTSNGVLTINPAATAVTLATDSAGDVFILATATNELTGGSPSTVINIGGSGVVRLNTASNYAGSWNLPSGRLELANGGALGNGATSVTLSGGILAGRSNSALTMTGPGSNLLLTANSSILSDRAAGSNGAGVNHTFGTLSMGTRTLTIAPGVNPISGTASITLGDLTLTGNPVLAVEDNGIVNGKLITGSLLGGGSARTIIKTGAGDLAVTGGSTDLPIGSSFTTSGGGTMEMLFPDLGVGSPVIVTTAQNPFGSASVSVTDGILRLLANGSNSSAAQTFELASSISLSGSVTLDPDERSGSNSNKTFELPGLTLAAGTELSMSGDNLYGVRLAGPLVLQGNATLKGSDTAGKDGLLTLSGGISGGPSTTLSFGGGSSPLNLTINAAGTYGGGTTMSGGNVTLNAANVLGPGALVMNGGSLIVNADNPLGGAIFLNGGTLRVNDTNALASTPITLNGGTLDFRNNGPAAITTGMLTVTGSGALSLGNLDSGSSHTFEFQPFNVSGNSTLTVIPSNSFVPYLNGITLAGNLTLANTGTLRLKSITEDSNPRALVKAGAGTLRMEDTSSHSGGTEVIAGILQLESSTALGSGPLTLGDVSGTTAATANFINGLTIANNIVVRAGSSGLLTLGSPGGGVIWNGNVNLQNAVTLANASTSFPSSLNGVISGAGAITKTSTNSEIVFGNPANSFVGNLLISGGTITVESNGALGHSSNGLDLTGSSSTLKIVGSFASSRTLTFTNNPAGVNVTEGNEFTLNQPLAGTGTFRKTGPGIMTMGPNVDSSLTRGGALTAVNGGTLRLQGAKNLSDNGNLTLLSGTVALLRDANTTFPYIVAADDTGTLHVDRGIGGSGTNGRHTLGSIAMNTGILTVTGANGYGLSLGALTTTNTSTITNNAPGELQVDSLGASGGSSSPAMIFGGTGNIRITGGINSGALSIYGITKSGPGTLHFGTSVLGFARAAVVNDGALDLNDLNYNVNALTLGGAASALGARLFTGGSGSLTLGGTLTFSEATSPPGASITGNLALGDASRNFVIGNSTNAPVDLDINGPISGSVGCAINKSGTGTLRFSGVGNSQPGLVTVSAGVLELGKASGASIGTGGLRVVNNFSVVRLLAGEQIHDAAPISIDNSGFLELEGFTETVGSVSFTQTTPQQYNAIRTGTNGTLILKGDLTFNNNSNSTATDARNILITGTGTSSTATTTGTLDLGGAVRTMHVASTTVGPNEPRANATIETRVVNGGIRKTGPRTLYLTNPDNSFAGGLEIADGFVQPGGGSSLGLGPIIFSNPPGVSAGLDFGTATGILENDVTTASGGESAFTYSALSPNFLTLSGNFNIGGDIVFNVVEGTVVKGSSAVLDVVGSISDSAGHSGLRKLGNGILKLAPGNRYGGSTVIEKGVLAIAAGSALGDTNAPLTLNGGCLASSASFDLSRAVMIGAKGGNFRADESSHVIELKGDLAWSSGTTTIDGMGRTVLSGTTTGPGGDLVLGAPIAFATGATNSTTWKTRLCLQGAAALPAGNLSMVNGSVLELGNSNFTRPLGTGPGEVQLPTSQGAGWAAVGANRSVNLGGAGATLIWGQASPAFLYNPSLGGTGPLILGSDSGTHTVDFQNPVHFTGGSFGVNRTIVTNDGPANVDARISGDLGQAGSPLAHNIILNTHGTLEIAGDIRGDIGLTHAAAGRTILSGTNDITRQLRVNQGTLELAGNDSLGSPNFIEIEAGATLDASALTVPLTTNSNFFLTQTVDGLLDGDLLIRGDLVGNGEVSGSVTAATPFTTFTPTLGGTFRIGGDLTFQAETNIGFTVENTTPETGYSRIQVAGSVNLAGTMSIPANYPDIPDGFSGTLVFILNDGNDPINGTFSNLTEGALIPLGDGRSLRITYFANGDGGPVGNDFGAIVEGTSSATDLSLTAVTKAAVAPLGNIAVIYTVTNLGPNPAANPYVTVYRPWNATFAPPYPANSSFFSPFQNELFVSLDTPLAAGITAAGFTVHFTAPAANGSVGVSAALNSSSPDLNFGNNTYLTLTAVLPSGAPVINLFNTNPTAGSVQVGIETIQNIRYVLQRSPDLDDWENVSAPFFGNGNPVIINEVMSDTREFFRFGIVPQGANSGIGFGQ